MKTLGRLTWEQMQLQYPNKWVVVTDYIKDGPDLVEGDLLAVLNDNEIDDFMASHWGKNYFYDRTTEESGVGIIHGKNIKFTIE